MRGGVPHAMRYKVWLSISGGLKLWEASPNLYANLLLRATNGECKVCSHRIGRVYSVRRALSARVLYW